MENSSDGARKESNISVHVQTCIEKIEAQKINKSFCKYMYMYVMYVYMYISGWSTVAMATYMYTGSPSHCQVEDISSWNKV